MKSEGYQKHHIIPQSMKGHPAVLASGMDIHEVGNIIYLPKHEGTHPTRSVHNGYHKAYNESIEFKLDKLEKIGKQNNWKQADYKNAVNDLIKQERNDLRKGKTNLKTKKGC